MALAHLKKRNGYYYIRLRIPKDIAPLFPRREIWQSLRTKSYKSARILRGMYLSQAHKFFALARTGMINSQEMNQIIQHESQKLLLALEKVRCMDLVGFDDEGNGKSPSQAKFPEPELRRSAENEMQRCMDALRSNDFSCFKYEIEAILWSRKLEFKPGSFEHGLFCRNLLKAKIQACRIELERCEGNYDNEFDQLITPNIFKPSHPALPHQSTTVATKEQQPTMTLSEGMKRFMKTKKTKAPGTIKNYNSMNKLLLKILKDHPLDTYSYEKLQDVREILEQIPKRATSLKGMENATIEELISIENPGELFSETNVMKYLTHMNTLFKYFEKRRWAPQPVRPEWEMSREGKKKKKKLPFDSDDLQEFFSSNHYASPRRRYTSPENYWCELISALSGARVDEVCQLYKEDIVEVNGIPCFDLNEEKDKKLKTENCPRKIPIHPLLIDLGLLDYIKFVKGDRLFMNLKRHPDHGYSHDYDKNINKYIHRHVTNDAKKSFHSFRKAFAKFLKQKGVHNEVIGSLLGHKAENEVTEDYAGDYPADVLLETIRKLDFGFDLVKTIGKWDPVVARRVAKGNK